MSTQRNEAAMTTSDQRAEAWKPIPGFSKYEAGDLGHVRSARTGNVLAVRPSNSGYLLVKLYDDTGKQQTKTVHGLVLLTFAGPRPDGQETLHGRGGPLDNRWPENIRYGTKPENAADRAAAGTARTPAAHPCVNHGRCGGMVAREGSRCLPCVQAVGREAALMLNDGVGLDDVTRRLGYQNAAWVHKLACEFGGYSKSSAHARAQRQPWSRRVMTTLRDTFSVTRKRLQKVTLHRVSDSPKGNAPEQSPASPARSLGPVTLDKWDIRDTFGTTQRDRVAVRNPRPMVTQRHIRQILTLCGDHR